MIVAVEVKCQRVQVTMKLCYNSLIIQFRTIYTIALECLLNGLHWRKYALSECFYSCCNFSCNNWKTENISTCHAGASLIITGCDNGDTSNQWESVNFVTISFISLFFFPRHARGDQTLWRILTCNDWKDAESHKQHVDNGGVPLK